MYTQTVNLTGTTNAQISHHHAAGWVPAVPLDRNVIWSPWAHPCQLLCRYRCTCFLTPMIHSSTLTAQTLCLTDCLAYGKAVHGNEVPSSHGSRFTMDRLLKLSLRRPSGCLWLLLTWDAPKAEGTVLTREEGTSGPTNSWCCSSFSRLLSSPLLHTQSSNFLADVHLFPYLMWEITVMFQGSSLRGV